MPCKRPGELRSFADSLMDVQLSDGTVIRGARSAVRTTVVGLGGPEQAIRIVRAASSGCSDTTVSSSSVRGFFHEGIGGTHDPLLYQIFPARELYSKESASAKYSYAELYGMVGYGGLDTSSRKIGFSSVYEGVEAIIAPLGDLFGERLSLGVGGGLMFEGGRMRFPLFGHLRFDLFGAEKVINVTYYIPDSCRFRIPGEAIGITPNGDYAERSLPRADSTVLFIQEKKRNPPSWRPFVYAEGGTVFDGKFDGAGTPIGTVNPDDRKPLLLGAGLGTLIGDNFTLSLGYRYVRLHLATPCLACGDRFVINTNRINSITLKAGFRLPW